jgi:D-alanine-D-alanine ligase-like ATP-grasp enzyme
VLGLLEIPYAGSLPSACRVAFDKPVAKALVAAAGLVTPASVTLPREAFLIVDGSGAAYFLEVNVAPGMTRTSTLPMAMRADGPDFAACCRMLLERAVAQMA